MSQYMNVEYKEDYYAILGIDRTATTDEITKAYRVKARYYHPDRESGNEHLFKLLNEANAVLSDSTKKERYDEFWDRTYKFKNGTPKSETRIAVVKDYYKELNIAKTDDQEAIRDAYLKVLKQFRPKLDGPDSELARTAIASAEEAYGVLSRIETKSLYDGEYERVYTIARSSETPRVSGEKTYIAKRPTAYVAPTPKATPNKVVPKVNRPKTVATATKKDNSVAQAPQGGSLVVKYNDKDVFVSTINRELLGNIGTFAVQTSNNHQKIRLRNMYAIFQEDNSFTFAIEVRKERLIFHDDVCLYRFPSGVQMLKIIFAYDDDLIWRNQAVIELGGLKSLAVPAEKIIPISEIDCDGCVSYETLQRIRERIAIIMANHPEMVNSFFGKGSKQK